ncbi:MAG: hypothetical protein WA952_12205 [Lewinella sp.]
MMIYLRFFQLWFCLIGLAGSSIAQSTDTLPKVQLSYGLHLWQPTQYTGVISGPEMVPDDFASGVSLDVEARLNRMFSLLAMLGTEVERGFVSYGNLPIETDNSSESGVIQSIRMVGPVERQYRRFYVGLGLQGNLRIGRGDLSLGAVGTFGPLKLREIISVGDVEPIYTQPDSQYLRPPLGLPYSATLQYATIWQTGMRAHLAYTYWIDRRFALRAGAYVGVRGGITVGGKHDDPASFVLRETTYSEAYEPGVHSYSLPDEALFDPGDPTVARWQQGITVGMIYKPLRKRQP